ncbi:hypothetical protein SAMN02745116_02548 [Pilibacter termitis]|uniref:FERM domain-containing protein n=1 Tax=Pilibacter termitis TaxID=263852 RepID=A0A1T4RCW2_9ENTE|nr:hypothetical protein SAMN02745116_02548 [Pilibacter termitis]
MLEILEYVARCLGMVTAIIFCLAFIIACVLVFINFVLDWIEDVRR